MQSGSVRIYKMCHMWLGLLRTCVWLMYHFITCCKWLIRLPMVYNEKQHNQAYRMVRATECLSNTMYRSNGSFNIPPPPAGIWLFWKLSFKFPPTRAKMPFKCPTLGSIQVIKCPHPGTFHRHMNDRRTEKSPSVVKQNLYKYSK